VVTDSAEDITQLLVELRSGNQAALEHLTPLVYRELRKVAAGYLRRERSDHTLQPTALVHEAYLRLVDQRDVVWQNRAHFLGVAAQQMRRVLLNHARARGAAKRAGVLAKVTLDDARVAPRERDVELIALEDALQALTAKDPQLARLVELRYFGGLTIDETAEVLGVSHATVEREWAHARAWLLREIRGQNRA
jgi:RNA polymerase sigma factor (TIGR02999 family)